MAAYLPYLLHVAVEVKIFDEVHFHLLFVCLQMKS
jgi:hypothetical protein